MTDAVDTREMADWLGLAAAPAFAVMAVISGVAGDGQPALCTAGDANAALNGMAFMYLLMSVFHLPPWVRALGPTVPRHRGAG